MNICINCRYLEGADSSTVHKVQWYDMRCVHPGVRRLAVVDPVTGLTRYESTNDLGGKVLNDEEFPYPRDINTDGNCRLYEERGA